MLKFSPQQFKEFNEQTESRILQAVAKDVLDTIKMRAPKLVEKYLPDDCWKMVLDVVTCASAFGIKDRAQLADWGYIRMATNVKFFHGSAFEFVLNHPFLHPYAKGRHIVLAYFSIQRMEQERFFVWQ